MDPIAARTSIELSQVSDKSIMKCRKRNSERPFEEELALELTYDILTISTSTVLDCTERQAERM